MNNPTSATVFSICNQKGGTGKTTLTMNLAAGLHAQGRTLIIDADPQQSASQWAAISSDKRPYPVPVISIAGNLTRDLKNFTRDYQFILIDCPPTLETEVSQQAIRVSDHVLIPTLPSPVDLWGSVRLTETIEKIRMQHAQLKASLVINQLEPRSALSRGMQQAVTEFDIPCLDSHIHRRAVYRNSALEGLSVFCMGKRGHTAVAEINALIEEIL